MKRKYLLVAVCGLLLLLLLGGGLLWLLSGDPALKVLDTYGNVLITANSPEELFVDDRSAYLHIVTEELLDILVEEKGYTRQNAQQQLFTGGYTVYTAFDPDVFQAVSQAKQVWGQDVPMGCAVTDLSGNLVAVGSTQQDVNYALNSAAPYSSFKPLSVYMQAVEANTINWSSTYIDSPYKQLDDGSGSLTDWPQNPNHRYSQEAVMPAEAIRSSLNTVAVKCLVDVGVLRSISFLQNNFSMPLSTEQAIAVSQGEEEVLGNIALGYLSEGMTPVDMAGYYQIFANGGKYTAPKAINKVQKGKLVTLYTKAEDSRQVISTQTADIMNYLLQEVVSSAGTGKNAACPGIDIAGKTGTGDGGNDNWFIGVSPVYSCAVWHGEATKNRAAEVFASVMQSIYQAKPEIEKTFWAHDNLYQNAVCTRSGMGATADCPGICYGYFRQKDPLQPCNQHGKSY